MKRPLFPTLALLAAACGEPAIYPARPANITIAPDPSPIDVPLLCGPGIDDTFIDLTVLNSTATDVSVYLVDEACNERLMIVVGASSEQTMPASRLDAYAFYNLDGDRIEAIILPPDVLFWQVLL